MDTNHALAAFAALGQQTRIDAFRLLVKAGPEGMNVGEIAASLGVRDNTMSVALSVLAQAGLVVAQREGRANRYVADMSGVRGLIDYLTEDCCGGQPELCAPSTEDYLMPAARNVLFLCSGNSARSLIAEAILNAEGAGRFRAYSAGSTPRGGPHPYTLDLLRGLGHDLGALRAKSWDEFAGPEAPQMDFVFTVCDKAAAEPCPVWPGQPVTAHWGLPDPVIETGNEAERRLAFSEAYRMLRNRITAFISLPVESLDRLALKRAVDDIGQGRA
ncbi:helix-turn-helix domain-containing protein [Sinisalibacter aestuarii]|uniref:ArsR family transcriptional regulator n=1 Tax=Sinisalibacter aestuarii TaxID=2949426 RepID=A0ABQ5LXL7_9RHOB|nr:helix-turn-helix domain-containing protein [Sinisalibacter aestuarii]GKY89533.1 ArsR family transcriptional regulator [Sinisalibacter aestuarii]